jgi:hypothetical protein
LGGGFFSAAKRSDGYALSGEEKQSNGRVMCQGSNTIDLNEEVIPKRDTKLDSEFLCGGLSKSDTYLPWLAQFFHQTTPAALQAVLGSALNTPEVID